MKRLKLRFLSIRGSYTSSNGLSNGAILGSTTFTRTPFMRVSTPTIGVMLALWQGSSKPVVPSRRKSSNGVDAEN